MEEIITGEKIQQICDMYIGNIGDLNYNPIISRQLSKHLHIHNINEDFNNCKYIFCYSHLINELSSKIKYFKQKFILITHNSDYNIENTREVNTILDCSNLIKWYGQNVTYQHYKLQFIPIGIANSMWAHGNLSIFGNLQVMTNLHHKTKYIYFNFNINTNYEKREPCYKKLTGKLEWLNNIQPVQNLYRLKDYQFCICPEGNGVDTHRLWECLYLKVVPIVINSPFSQMLKTYNIPIVILNDWDDLFNENLIYTDFNFNDDKFINILNYTKLTRLLH